MRKLKIKTAPCRDGYKAWLEADPKSSSTSTAGPSTAARNLAVRLFFGHNHYAQLDSTELDKVIVSQLGHGTYLATYDGGSDAHS